MLYPTIPQTAATLLSLPADVLTLIREACPPEMLAPDKWTRHSRERREWASKRIAQAMQHIQTGA